MIELEQKIPEFKLPATQAGTLSDKDLQGKYAVIYFYPKDNTPGCTTETNDFCELYKEFQGLNCEIIGFNNNPMKLHEKFEKKLEIPFPLVSDEDQGAVEAFGVWQLKKFMGKEYDGILRSSFLIDEKGTIEKVWSKVNTKTHASDILSELG